MTPEQKAALASARARMAKSGSGAPTVSVLKASVTKEQAIKNARERLSGKVVTAPDAPKPPGSMTWGEVGNRAVNNLGKDATAVAEAIKDPVGTVKAIPGTAYNMYDNLTDVMAGGIKNGLSYIPGLENLSQGPMQDKARAVKDDVVSEITHPAEYFANHPLGMAFDAATIAMPIAKGLKAGAMARNLTVRDALDVTGKAKDATYGKVTNYPLPLSGVELNKIGERTLSDMRAQNLVDRRTMPKLSAAAKHPTTQFPPPGVTLSKNMWGHTVHTKTTPPNLPLSRVQDVRKDIGGWAVEPQERRGLGILKDTFDSHLGRKYPAATRTLQDAATANRRFENVKQLNDVLDKAARRTGLSKDEAVTVKQALLPMVENPKKGRYLSEDVKDKLDEIIKNNPTARTDLTDVANRMARTGNLPVLGGVLGGPIGSVLGYAPAAVGSLRNMGAKRAAENALTQVIADIANVRRRKWLEGFVQAPMGKTTLTAIPPIVRNRGQK